MKNLKITIEIAGDTFPLSIDPAKEINSIPNPNERAALLLDIMLGVNVDINLSDWFIAEFRKKMIALNAKFKFHSNEITKGCLKYYVDKIEMASYFDADEVFENYVKECALPKIGNDGI